MKRSTISEHVRSNVVGYVSLFFVLTGGVAWATHPGGANTISSGDIIDQQVKRADISNNAVNPAKVAPDSLTAGDLAPAAVQFPELDPAAFAPGDLSPQGSPPAVGVSPDAIQSSEITDGTITGADVASNSLDDADVDEPALGLGSAYVERTADLSLTTSYAKVLEADPVVDAPAQLLATASLELDGDGGEHDNGGDDHAFCFIEIDGANGPLYGHTIPDTLYDRATISIVFARAAFPGAHGVDLWCKRNLDPEVVVTDAGMTVAALPLGP